MGILDRLKRNFDLQRKRHQASREGKLFPECLYRIEVTETHIVCRPHEEVPVVVAWSDLSEVSLETNESGPWGTDMYWNLGSKWVLGVRGSTSYVDGELPFYAAPYIDMRGIPAMRYQGSDVALGETEVRWNFHPRIGLVGL